MNQHLYAALVASALIALGCAREPSNNASTEAALAPRPALKPKPAVTTPAVTQPASLAGMPGPLAPEPGFHHGNPAEIKPAVSVKHTGKLGELLEGDVYYFKLSSLRPCGEQPDPKTAKPNARRVVAAEVEITAKEELNVSPRDVTIGVGGIVFNGSVDRKRTIEGCSPRLEISRLRSKQVATGYVLFDIPVTGPGSNLGEMGLIYQPTRFGGAGRVLVQSLSSAGAD